MNTNPNAERILCFGDSNTWGQTPNHTGRYRVNVRWPGVLQDILGLDYEVIEEGLGGRTTLYDDPKKEARNGKDYLIPCLLSHNPLDVVILFLGTNDLKDRFNQTTIDIANSMQILINIVKSYGKNKDSASPRIIIIAPSIPDIKHVHEDYKNMSNRVEGLSAEFKKIADSEKVDFVDLASNVKSSSIDGLHLEEGAHVKIAELVVQVIRNSNNPTWM
jgi:lysophospholipase L1-like esterase